MKKSLSKAVSCSDSKVRTRVGRLKSSDDVAKYIARCIKRAERGEGEENRRYKLVMMASMLLKAIEAADIEKRVTRLEDVILKEPK